MPPSPWEEPGVRWERLCGAGAVVIDTHGRRELGGQLGSRGEAVPHSG